VQPEDHQIARRDYRAHMQMVQFLANDVPVALHAGELTLGLVPPDDLTFHITDAVAAGARRIGHGTALAYEHDVNGLLQAMRRRPVAIEISLTSSDLILGVRGKDHPLPAYLAAGVPVVLATDDAGVSRIDLTPRASTDLVTAPSRRSLAMPLSIRSCHPMTSAPSSPASTAPALSSSARSSGGAGSCSTWSRWSKLPWRRRNRPADRCGACGNAPIGG
jgi:hypothetical protein